MLLILLAQRLAERPELIVNPLYRLGPRDSAVVEFLEDFAARELARNSGYWVRALNNSRLFWPFVMRKVQETGLPPEITWLPIIESAFDPFAVSRKGAVGVWQFVPKTARRYGLRVDTWVDERRDPVKSTDAALRHLRDLFAEFGEWDLALAAYNAGAGRVYWALYQASLGRRRRATRWRLRRAKRWWLKRGKPLSYWEARRYLPRETRRYVPLFYTALLAVEMAESLGVNLMDTLPYPLPSDTLLVYGPTDLHLVAQLAGVPPESLLLRNPELRLEITPPNSAWKVKVPLGTAERVVCALEELPEREVVIWTRYRVRRGDSWWRIARRFGTTVKALRKANRWRRLRRGRWIRVPVKVKAKSLRDTIYAR